MKSIVELVRAYAEAKRSRMAFEKLAAEYKANKEEPAKADLLMAMTVAGVKSVKLAEFGTISVKEKDHYEITDMEKLAEYLYSVMSENAQSGIPLADAMLLQARVKRDVLEAYLANSLGNKPIEDATDEDLAPFGVKRATQMDISIRNS